MLATVVVLLVTASGLYLLLQREILSEMDEQLDLQSEILGSNVNDWLHIDNPFMQIAPAGADALPGVVYGDTTIYDPLQKKDEEYRYRKEIKEINGRRYSMYVMIIYIGWDQYFNTIFLLLGMAILALGISGALITYYSNKKLWRPFFLNLQSIKSYSITDPEPPQLRGSPIKEFEELRATLMELTERSRREYKALREFTENASHEIQTPLGIIQSKLDRLSQSELTEEMANYIMEARSGVERLSKTNKALLLLAKLDNNVFADKQLLAFHTLLNQHIESLTDLFLSKELTLDSDILPCDILANLHLCETLVSNLISNALRHCNKGGNIIIQLNANQLAIANSGPPLDFPPDQLFRRFKKGDKNSQGTGLGLAIVSQICLLNHWQISYSYEKELHTFTIAFNRSI